MLLINQDAFPASQPSFFHSVHFSTLLLHKSIAYSSPETHRQCVVLVRPANIELRLLSLTLPHSVLSSRTRNSSGVWRRVKASMVEETFPQCLNHSWNFGYKNKLFHPMFRSSHFWFLVFGHFC